MHKVLLSAAAGLLTATGLLWVSWELAPYPFIDGQEYESVLQLALSTQLNDTPTPRQDAVYIKTALKSLAARLQTRFPQRQILPWSQRPADHGCEENNGHIMAPCARDDYLSLDSAIFPLWRTALVTISTANSGSQILLMKLGSHWTVVSTKGFVI
jgi:hypothetical protein